MSCDQEMMCEMDSDFKWHFESLADFFFDELLPTEQASLSYDAEDTYFLRMNHAKVRQNGFVKQAAISVTIYKNKQTYRFAQGLSGLLEQDKETLAAALENARSFPKIPISLFLLQATIPKQSMTARCFRKR